MVCLTRFIIDNHDHGYQLGARFLLTGQSCSLVPRQNYVIIQDEHSTMLFKITVVYRFIMVHAREAITVSSSVRWTKDGRNLDRTGAIFRMCRCDAPRAAEQSTVVFAASRRAIFAAAARRPPRAARSGTYLNDNTCLNRTGFLVTNS